MHVQTPGTHVWSPYSLEQRKRTSRDLINLLEQKWSILSFWIRRCRVSNIHKRTNVLLSLLRNAEQRFPIKSRAKRDNERICVQRPLTLTIGNRGRALRAGGIPVGGGRLDGTETTVTLVGHLAAIVRVLSVTVRWLLGVRRSVFAECLEGRLLLLAWRRAAAAARVLAALVIIDGRFVLRCVVLLNGSTCHAALHDVSFRELARHLETALLNSRKKNPIVSSAWKIMSNAKKLS